MSDKTQNVRGRGPLAPFSWIKVTVRDLRQVHQGSRLTNSYPSSRALIKGDRRGSNPRPSEPQSDALPTELRPPSAKGILPAKDRRAKLGLCPCQSPQPRNSVFLSSRLPSSMTRKSLEGFGVLMMTTFPWVS